MTDIDWEPIIEIAGKVAVELSSKWSIVEADDVKQEILLHMMEEKGRIAGEQDNPEFLRRVAWTAGKRYAAKERAYHDLMDDQYYYTPEEARLALRSFLFTDEELSTMMWKKDDLLRATVTDNLVSARIDAADSMKKLPQHYQEVLQRQFIYGLPAADDNERRMGYRAADALALAMNRTLRTRKGVVDVG